MIQCLDGVMVTRVTRNDLLPVRFRVEAKAKKLRFFAYFEPKALLAFSSFMFYLQSQSSLR